MKHFLHFLLCCARRLVSLQPDESQLNRRFSNDRFLLEEMPRDPLPRPWDYHLPSKRGLHALSALISILPPAFRKTSRGKRFLAAEDLCSRRSFRSEQGRNRLLPETHDDEDPSIDTVRAPSSRPLTSRAVIQPKRGSASGPLIYFSVYESQGWKGSPSDGDWCERPRRR